MKYYTELRYRLMPYIYSLAAKTYFDDYTLMRALVMDYTNDPQTYNISDQFLFGPSLMACPVYQYQARSREVYFPKGSWYDFYSGKTIEGGKRQTVEAPYERIPLYVKAGAILPTGELIQSTKEAQKDLILKVYAGADGDFMLYEDNGVTYAYEQGAFARIPLHYTEANRTLSIGAQAGDYPEMIRQRKLTIRLISPEHPEGMQQEVAYEGKAIEVKF